MKKRFLLVSGVFAFFFSIATSIFATGFGTIQVRFFLEKSDEDVLPIKPIETYTATFRADISTLRANVLNTRKCIRLINGQDDPESLAFAGEPKALHEVIPVYPKMLRDKGIEGRVELLIGVNKEGNVEAVKVTKSLHPYLDNAAVQALKQWRFVPIVKNGKPVSAIITTHINFNRQAYLHQEEMLADKESYPSESGAHFLLKETLEGGAKYCGRLLESALTFICEETIRDVFSYYKTPEELKKSAVSLALIGGNELITQMGGARFTAAKGRTERNEYVCDYLLIKKAGVIEERRIIIKENGHSIADRSRLLEERRFSCLAPLLKPIEILGREWQGFFNYRILKEDRVRGKEYYVIEAKPKLGDAGGNEYSKIWVRKKDYQISKIEISGVPLEGYEDVLRELAFYNLSSKFMTTFLYEAEKNGIAFPSSVVLQANYPFPGLESEAYISEKISTKIRYAKYKFFSIGTESGIRGQ